MIRYLHTQLYRTTRDQNGQAVVFVGLILLTLASFVAVTINIGNFVAAKIRMQNVVDAAALNGAVWEARSFNIIMALNTAIFSAEWVATTELMEALYWLARAASCGFWPWCWPLWIKFAIEMLDFVLTLMDVEDLIDNINNVQSSIARDITPINVAAAWVYEIGMNPYNESSWFYILPGTYYFSGSALFSATPWGGDWYDLFLAKLACNNTGGGIWFSKRFETTADYPNHQWLFYFSYREPVEAAMMRRDFDAGGVGYFVMAQVGPYSKANSSWLDYTNIYSGDTWDVRLMPINFDDMIWHQLFGWFPPLQWLFAAVSNLLILH